MVPLGVFSEATCVETSMSASLLGKPAPEEHARGQAMSLHGSARVFEETCVPEYILRMKPVTVASSSWWQAGGDIP